MDNNVNLMIFILSLVLLLVFCHILETGNTYLKGKFFSRFIPICGIIATTISTIIFYYIELKS